MPELCMRVQAPTIQRRSRGRQQTWVSAAASAASATHGRAGIHVHKPCRGGGTPFHLPPRRGLLFCCSVPPWAALAPDGAALAHVCHLSPLARLDRRCLNPHGHCTYYLPTCGTERSFLYCFLFGLFIPAYLCCCPVMFLALSSGIFSNFGQACVQACGSC